MSQISSIELIPVKAQQGLVFFANCILNDSLYLGNIAVFTKRDGSGFRCVYPTKKLINGTQIPIFHPINSDFGNALEEAISNSAHQLFSNTEKGGG
jgi:DNA-binding cell septation regulator SpoVG